MRTAWRAEGSEGRHDGRQNPPQHGPRGAWAGELASATDATRLTPRMSAGAGLRHLLRELTSTMRVHERGLDLNLGPESLHDFRVAVRRARCLLSQTRRVFRRRDVAFWDDGLHRLQQRSDALRNVDTLLGWIAGRGPRDGDPQDLARLCAHLRRRRKAELRSLLAHLRSPEHRAFMDGLQDFLDRPAQAMARGRRAGLPLAEVVGRRGARMHRRLLKERRGLRAGSPADDLHAFRKRARKLRDLLQGTRDALGAERVRPLVKALGRVTDELGSAQDARMHLAVLDEAPRTPAIEAALRAKGRKAKHRQVRKVKALGRRRLRRLVATLATPVRIAHVRRASA
ncbi:MAG TPA: CHAD domain-containing protein [Planctomycetota bacterium]|nr:CHAD domain-containing protein [Planctomycetota bacterium]